MRRNSDEQNQHEAPIELKKNEYIFKTETQIAPLWRSGRSRERVAPRAANRVDSRETKQPNEFHGVNIFLR